MCGSRCGHDGTTGFGGDRVTAVKIVLSVTFGLVAIGLALVVTGVGILAGTAWALVIGGALLAVSAVGAAAALLWGTEK
jgi:hypothetical protein